MLSEGNELCERSTRRHVSAGQTLRLVSLFISYATVVVYLMSHTSQLPRNSFDWISLIGSTPYTDDIQALQANTDITLASLLHLLCG